MSRRGKTTSIHIKVALDTIRVVLVSIGSGSGAAPVS